MTHVTPADGLSQGRLGQTLAQAADVAAGLPSLLAEAQKLSSTVMLGEHGRKRAGQGDEFWQYRAAHQGDFARMIDWRRSGRSDGQFVREREWQAAQSVNFWVDQGLSMQFSADAARDTKLRHAQILCVALSQLLLAGGEKVGIWGALGAQSGRLRLPQIATALLAGAETAREFSPPPTAEVPAHSQMVVMSDFFGPMAGVEAILAKAVAVGTRGILLQVLDPIEADFPFDGRVIFRSMSGALAHETRKAGDLRARYQTRLRERHAQLEAAAKAAGWLYHCHYTGASAQAALLWLYGAMQGDGRR